jgi:hypothetical protein
VRHNSSEGTIINVWRNEEPLRQLHHLLLQRTGQSFYSLIGNHLLHKRVMAMAEICDGDCISEGCRRDQDSSAAQPHSRTRGVANITASSSCQQKRELTSRSYTSRKKT